MSDQETVSRDSFFSWTDLINKIPEADSDFEALSHYVLLYLREEIAKKNEPEIKLSDLATVNNVFNDDGLHQNEKYIDFSFSDLEDGELEDLESFNVSAKLFLLSEQILQVIDLEDVQQ